VHHSFTPLAFIHPRPSHHPPPLRPFCRLYNPACASSTLHHSATLPSILFPPFTSRALRPIQSDRSPAPIPLDARLPYIYPRPYIRVIYETQAAYLSSHPFPTMVLYVHPPLSESCFYTPHQPASPPPALEFGIIIRAQALNRYHAHLRLLTRTGAPEIREFSLLVPVYFSLLPVGTQHVESFHRRSRMKILLLGIAVFFLELVVRSISMSSASTSPLRPIMMPPLPLSLARPIYKQKQGSSALFYSSGPVLCTYYPINVCPILY
jgi:hypothetical protein